MNIYTGNLKYNQWLASVGVRHYFKEEIIETYNIFAEAGFHYTRLNTAGVYEGGQFGSAYHKYTRYKGVGFSFKAGSVYQFNSPWYIGANLGLYISGGKVGEISSYRPLPDPEPEIEDLPFNESLNRFALEVRIGYRFGSNQPKLLTYRLT